MMTPYLPFLFPVFFVFMWLIVTTLLGFITGWYTLMKRYPDCAEKALLEIKGQSGFVGPGVGMQRVLNVSVCPSGLRVGIMRIFGPFCQDFFVPWQDISIERKNTYFLMTAVLSFGQPVVGKLGLPVYLANRLARAAAERWPEPGSFPEETPNEVFARVAKQWAFLTLLASLFFILVPRIMGASAAKPPLAIAIIFPAVVFGIGALITYCVRTTRNKHPHS